MIKQLANTCQKIEIKINFLVKLKTRKKRTSTPKSSLMVFCFFFFGWKKIFQLKAKMVGQVMFAYFPAVIRTENFDGKKGYCFWPMFAAKREREKSNQ